MKKIIAIILCSIILCGCEARQIITYTEDEATNTTSQSSLTSKTSADINFLSKIYKAKNTTNYNNSMLFPTTGFKSVDENQYFYYSNLSQNYKSLYKKLCTSIECMADGFIDLGYINDNEIDDLVTAIKNDRPEYFWLGHDFIINTQNDGFKQIAFKFKSNDYSIDYLYSLNDRNKILSDIKNKILNIANNLKNKSAYEIELYIHDYINKNCNYDKSAINNATKKPYAYNIVGSILQGKAVCEGYAKAIQLLNNYFGINTTVLVGLANNQNHMWNLVQIDGNYYHLDATFNDGENENLYSYFNLTDIAIKRTHKLDMKFYKNITLPGANSYEKSYFVVNKSFITEYPEQDIESAINEALVNQISSLDFGYYDNATTIYKNSDEMSKDNINITQIFNKACMKNRVKIENIKIVFASNGNFKLMWDYK